MKDFNWEEFKKGNIEVGCPTEELAKDFLSKCKEQDITWSCDDIIIPSDTNWNDYQTDTIYGVWRQGDSGLFFPSKIGSLYYGNSRETKKQFIEWALDDTDEVKTKYSFEDIVVNRKPGQVWVGEAYKIIIDENNDLKISFKSKHMKEMGEAVYIDCSTEQYQLKEMGIPFSKALIECENNENKRMKSLVTDRVYRVSNKNFEVLNGVVWKQAELLYKEIKGAWVVYEV